MRPTQVLVLGGTGFVGRALLAQLVDASGGAGARLVVPTRRLRSARVIQSLPTVQVVQADVHDPAELATLLRGVDAVVNLIAILHGSSAAFEQVHADLPRTLGAACVAAGVRRVVHVSALGAAADAPSNYLRSKAAGEAAWRSFGDKLDVTILRPSVIFGAEDRFLNLFATLQAVFPVMPLAGAHAQFQPVWVDDVARAIVTALERPSTAGQTIECAGPQVYTLADLVRLAGLWSDHVRPVLPLPDVLGRLQATMMELAPGEPLMSRDNLDSMQVPNVAGGVLPGLASLGIDPAALDAVGPLYLGRAVAGRGRLNAFRAHARRH